MSKQTKIKAPSKYLATLLRDLNLFVFHITSIYRNIHARYVSRYPVVNHKTWSSLFLEYRRDKKITKRVDKIVRQMGFQPQDLENLNYLRNIRNTLCHPHLRVRTCMDLLEQNWKNHRCYESLRRVFTCAVLSDMVPQLRLKVERKRSLSNWRERKLPVKKNRSKSDEGGGGESEVCPNLTCKSRMLYFLDDELKLVRKDPLPLVVDEVFAVDVIQN